MSGPDSWIGELTWRDFYQQVLFNFPHVETEPFKKNLSHLKWRKSNSDWNRWTAGATGFPIVDAAMRQLNQTGWMHNRLRMIVAMFITKDLLLNYHLGERYFMQNLIDGETAQNNGGWQWSASTGTDAQPYFRIFNPTTQSKTFDPNGTFIRQYCPELAKVPNQFIHAPHEMGPAEQLKSACRIGIDYPKPIVDHAKARLRAIRMFKDARR
jgi:deoxyribodipyrimidine photo-lyase